MHDQESRNHRLCFRLPRWMYWRLRDDALDRGRPASSMVYWLLFAALADTAGMDQAAQDAWITSRLGDKAADRYRKEVEKGLAKQDRDGVPW